MIPGCRKWAVNTTYGRLRDDNYQKKNGNVHWTHIQKSLFETQATSNPCLDVGSNMQLSWKETHLFSFLTNFHQGSDCLGLWQIQCFLASCFLGFEDILRKPHIWWRKGIHSEVTTGHITNHTSHDWITENFQRTCQQDRQGLGTWETRQREAE